MSEINLPDIPTMEKRIDFKNDSPIANAVVAMKGRGMPDAEIYERVSVDRKLSKLRSKGFSISRIEAGENTVAIFVFDPAHVPAPAPVLEPAAPKKEHDLCPVTKKRMYSLKGAQRAMSDALGSGYGYTPKRCYWCDHCRSHHLTSKLY